MELNIQELQDLLQKSFVPERAAGVDATIQAHLNGENGGDWYVTIKDQKVDLHTGPADNPNLTVTMDAQDAMDLYQGRLDPTRAFMMGKIRLSGDTGLAMRLLGMFRVP